MDREELRSEIELKKEMLAIEIRALESDPENQLDTGWCLGDPYELLDELRRKVSELDIEEQRSRRCAEKGCGLESRG